MKRTVQELDRLEERCCRLVEGGDGEGRSLVPREAADWVSKLQPMVKELRELWSVEEYLGWVLRVRRLRCASVSVCEGVRVGWYVRVCVCEDV